MIVKVRYEYRTPASYFVSIGEFYPMQVNIRITCIPSVSVDLSEIGNIAHI